MTPGRTRGLLIGLLLVVALALAGALARRGGSGGCALEGLPISAAYRARVVADDGRQYEFCCIHCAQVWVGRQKTPPREIWLTDEVSGDELEAHAAFFVHSSVPTNPVTGNLIHVFRDHAAAVRHQDQWRGRLLEGDDRPFAITGHARHTR